jgi:ketosteroid isomerase-like protein
MRRHAIVARKRARRTTATLALMLLAPTMLLALFHTEKHEWRNELFQMEDNWRNALLHGNATAMSGLLADDFMAISANGMLETKEQTIAHMRSGSLRFRSLNISDRKVRFYGSTAVVTCRAEVTGTTPDGDISGNYRYTHVWVQEGNGPWRIVSFEASRIREPHTHP